MKNKIFAIGLVSASLILSCQIGNLAHKGFKIASTNPDPSASSPPIEYVYPPPNGDDSNQAIVDDSTDIMLNPPKQKLNFDFIPPENAKIIPGTIIVFYHNNDKFRVKTSDSVSSQNSSYSNQINQILKKYKVKALHSYGYYDPEDANRIICKGNNIEEDDDNDKSKKESEKNDKKFKVKKDNNEKEKKEVECNTLNYIDSSITTQKIQEEQILFNKYFEGEFPDKLSMHIYEFPENYDTKQIAKEIRSLSFVRTAYPEVETSISVNYPSCNTTSDILGITEENNKKINPYQECLKNTSSSKCSHDTGFSSILNPSEGRPFSQFEYFTNDGIFGTELQDWYRFNEHQIFRGWEVYGNTAMPKIGIVDSGFDNDKSHANLDTPHYNNGFSVEYTGKKSFLWWSWDTFKNNPDDIQEPNPPLTGIDNSHGHFVSSIAGSPRNNNKWLAGISYGADIFPIKLKTMSNSVTSRAIDELADNNLIDVVNASLGVKAINPITKMKNSYPLNYSPNTSRAVANAIAKGKIVVLAAGNDSVYLDDKYRINGAIVVGSTTNVEPTTKNSSTGFYKQDNGTYISDFSNYGSLVDIAASGQLVVSTKYFPASNTRLYGKDSGTSFSAPQIASAAGMVKKLAEANGVKLDPFQVKHIVCYSAKLAHDRFYTDRYLGVDLEDTKRTPNRIPNIRNLDLFNALTIAKNLSKYSVILRQHNVDDLVISTENGAWGNSFDFRGYKSDEIIGINNPNAYNLSIDFKTLNDSGGYTYGYQLYYGKKYDNLNQDFYAGYNFFDLFDGATGIYGAENNSSKEGKKYYAKFSKKIDRYGSPCNSLAFSTKAASIYGTNINGNTANEKNTLAQDIQNLKVNKNNVVFLAVSGDSVNVAVAIDGKNQQIVGKTSTAMAFTIGNDLTSGSKNIVVNSDKGSITLPNAIDVQTNTTSPELTTNTNTRVYLKMNEGNGITANDSTLNHNNATIFGNYSWLSSGEGIKLDGLTSYVSVPSTPSLDISKDITIEMVFTPNSDFVTGNDLSLANKYSSIYPYDNASWALNYGTYTGNSVRPNAFNFNLYSGSSKLLFLLGYDESVIANKKYYIQASWNSVTKEFNFVINGRELPVSYLGGVPNTLEPNQLNSFNLVTNPIILGGYTTNNPNQPVSFTKISIDEFALHGEYRTAQQGIETSQRFGIIN